MGPWAQFARRVRHLTVSLANDRALMQTFREMRPPCRFPVVLPGATNSETIYLVDDEPAVLEALERLIRSAGWVAVRCADPEDFLSRVAADAFGCIVLDMHMPAMSGLQLHEQLVQRDIDLPVIYLTGRATVSSVQAMKQGAIDLLEKPVDADVLLATIEQAMQRLAASRLQRSRHQSIRQKLDSLSRREREVMDHVIVGRLNKQIAGDLGIAIKTVKVHRGRVMEKFGVRSVAELVHLCDELGVTPD